MKKATPKSKPTSKGSKKPVVKVTKVTKPMKKSAVTNPFAPKGMGSGALPGLVRPITKSETFMKKGKAKGMNTRPAAINSSVPKGAKFPSSVPEKYKTKPKSALSYMDEQRLTKRGYESDASKAKTKKQAASSNPKGTKSNQGVKPKKKTPPAPKPTTPKSRFFGGRGMGGGMLGGGGFRGPVIK